MSLPDKAYNNDLSLSELKQYLSRDPSSLDAVGGNIALTPLCAACLGGHIDVVKSLLACGANANIASNFDRTPLFWTTDPRSKASTATRCAIIRELVSGKNGPKSKADLNKACDDDKNTPLMNAILELKDKVVIQQLLDSGASPDVKLYDQQKSAKELADEQGLSNWLVTKADRDIAWKNLIELVVSFVLLVVAYVNNKTLNRVTMTQDVLKKVEPKSVDDFKNFLNDEVKSGKFGKFFAPNDPFLTNLAEKANALRGDPDTDLGKPENIKRLTQLSLYHPVIYCDDSGSMSPNNNTKREDRYFYQKELVTRIAAIATKIVPDDMAGVDLRFINKDFSSTLTADQIRQAMTDAKPSGGTKIGTNLRRKILQPLVYDLIDKPNTASTPIPFRRPLLICIITDGVPGGEDRQTLRDEIVECKKRLDEKGYDESSVMFCINQVGTDEEAEKFLLELREEDKIKDVIYVTAGQLDTKFKEFKDNERALENWLLRLLASPIMTRGDD
ncbi:hypothetical protein CPB84DRAFT_1767818 [Gymnopilus junonius]|uniref:Ankyrin repeat protein n=1 Tax=Gymnopilus junonius TaxID=109634 RepID=A0A9P5NV94_GYMJU|nr:hypothetical protein CPB84DRAFT_1767818 [Gymnopilus junonius]